MTVFGAVTVLALAGCEQTKNVMVYATDTKVAFDVSGDPTGSPSLTLGYKRQEAVWMPLATPDLKEKEFKSDHTNGSDAYSVLGSFGMKFGTDGGEIAQYFATGLAARALASSGGAALVNPNALTEDQIKAVEGRLVKRNKQVSEIIEKVGTDDTDGTLNDAKWTALLTKMGAQNLTGLAELRSKTPEQADEALKSERWNIYIEPLHANLDGIETAMAPPASPDPTITEESLDSPLPG
jgi:hypothetical protein